MEGRRNTYSRESNRQYVGVIYKGQRTRQEAVDPTTEVSTDGNPEEILLALETVRERIKTHTDIHNEQVVRAFNKRIRALCGNSKSKYLLQSGGPTLITLQLYTQGLNTDAITERRGGRTAEAVRNTEKILELAASRLLTGQYEGRDLRSVLQELWQEAVEESISNRSHNL